MALSDDDLSEIREIFGHFDKDKNGVMDASEFSKLLDALGAEMTKDEVSEGLRALDDNKNGLIDFDEFVAWWADR